MRKSHLTLVAVTALAVLLTGCSKPEPSDSNATVPADGGKITVGGVTLDIPAGALDTPVTIGAKVLDEAGVGLIHPVGALAYVEFGPDGTRFNKSVTVTMPVAEMPAGSRMMAYYFNKAEGVWTAVGEARPAAGGVSFEIDHFSLYAVGGSCDYVNGWAQPLADKVRSGMSDEAIFSQFKSRIESGLEDLFSWDIIGGRYYRVSRYSEGYMYSIDGKEGQGNYQIGESGENWNGYHDISSLNLRYMSETQSYEKLDYNEFQTARNDRNEVCSSDFERELRLVPSVMTASASGELKKKGDKATVRIRLAAETTGETIEMKVFHSCVGFTSGYEDTTPEGSCDRIIRIPHDDPSLGENPPMAYQKLKLKVSDNSALKLSTEEVETGLEGEAVVTVTALKDNASGDVTATYDYSGAAESDHSEASVHVGGNDGTWYVSGKISDVRGESMFGIASSIDVKFEFSFNPDKKEDASAYGLGLTEVMPAEFRFVPSNVHISPKGQYILDFGSFSSVCYYSISNVVPRTLDNEKGYVICNSDGVYCAVAFNMADPTHQPTIVTYDVHTDQYWGSDLINSDDESEEWLAPFQFSFPLKEGSYAPIAMTAANSSAAQHDKEHFYIALSTGSLMSGAEDSTLTGEVTVSRTRPE